MPRERLIRAERGAGAGTDGRWCVAAAVARPSASAATIQRSDGSHARPNVSSASFDRPGSRARDTRSGAVDTGARRTDVRGSHDQDATLDRTGFREGRDGGPVSEGRPRTPGAAL